MPDHVIRHAVECDVDAYWKCVFDAEYNRRLYLDVLRFREERPIEQKETDATITRKIYLNPPPVDLPAAVAKVAGDISWVEEGTYDKATKRYRFKCIPASMPDRTRIEGELYCDARGPKAIERIAKISIDVKVFMIGSIIEKRIADDMMKSYEAAARFTSQYVREKGW